MLEDFDADRYKDLADVSLGTLATTSARDPETSRQPKPSCQATPPLAPTPP